MFLDSTPLGVSLKTPTIVIGKTPEVSFAVERNNPDNNAGSCTSLPTLQARELDYAEQIGILENWLREKGWTVKWYSTGEHIDAAILYNRTVTISKRQIPRHRYYSLLHECAHVDLLAGPQETRRGEPGGYLDLWYGEVNERTLRHRVAVVFDEISAWERGITIASQLGLSVDLKLYRKFRDRNLKSYFEWAANPKAQRL